ncbi:hypothetical protein pf16_64 [Pseudomonas phage pf16]|uniref:Uncharacterized protein n=1 Tax=Pseudomonas phage pf16 TaxID=1815630 RepID=A0A1S5R3K6_9CAUD|nr:hypothetical protein FDG98_gp234 [Pseudomonas phage pf16]AND74987.1 hypothetical protein pf16_64 [Pseudomonas phage pf16]
MRSRFANPDYEPTRSIDPFERVAEEMVRKGDMACEPGDDFDDEEARRAQDEYDQA